MNSQQVTTIKFRFQVLYVTIQSNSKHNDVLSATLKTFIIQQYQTVSQINNVSVHLEEQFIY